MIQSLIVAASTNDVIGDDGRLPWVLPDDLRRFRSITSGHAIVMGRKTHQSILARIGHPLRGRTSIVLSSDPADDDEDSVLWAKSLESAISLARHVSAAASEDEFFIAGGASVYRQAIGHATKVYLTRIHCKLDGDATMPAGWLEGFRLVQRADHADLSAGCNYSFLEYLREPS